MNKIEHRDSLPKMLRTFLQAMPGHFGDNQDTEIWEMSSIDELERGAAGLIRPDLRYEIMTARDGSNQRAYLIGFDAEDTSKVIADMYSSKLCMYYIEISDEEYRRWSARIKNDRQLQIEAMFEREEKAKAKAEAELAKAAS